MEREIKSQTAIYTGGGIYNYFGELSNGNYFLVDDGTETINILDANPMDKNEEGYVAYDGDWIEEHLVEGIEDPDFYINLLERLLAEGCTFGESNWADYEIEARLMEARAESGEWLVCYCSNCGKPGCYKMNDTEKETYNKYLVFGRQMGYIQELFPNVPNWIRSGAIDKYSGGFCICPSCCE